MALELFDEVEGPDGLWSVTARCAAHLEGCPAIVGARVQSKQEADYLANSWAHNLQKYLPSDWGMSLDGRIWCANHLPPEAVKQKSRLEEVPGD